MEAQTTSRPFLNFTFQLLLIVIVIPGVCMQWSGELSSYQTAAFDNPIKPELTVTTRLDHFTVHPVTGDVYVGAVNYLYRLDGNLTQVAYNDTATCYEETCLNYNKVLALEGGRLITCGSEDEGSCRSRKETDLLEDGRGTGSTNAKFVAAFGVKTTESIVAPGPESSSLYLYVAASYSAEVEYQRIPPVARRVLGEGRGFMFADLEEDVVKFSQPYTSNPFPIKYVDAFAWDGFTYFVTNETHQTPGVADTYLSKIVRVCHTSSNLNSYSEILIQCRGSDNSLFEFVQASHVGPAGPHLSDSLALDDGDQVLYAVFANEEKSTSALCVYKMSDIVAEFKETVRGCLQGGSANMYTVGHLQGDSCNGGFLGNVDSLLCNAGFEYKYATGIRPVDATAVVQLPGYLASTIITSTELNHTMAFIGTDSGQLLKVHIESGSYARLYEKVTLGNDPVRRDILISETAEEVFLLTEQKLIKMRVENCNQYTTCETCIGTDAGMDGDPYCGWCTLERKCTRYDACNMQSVSTRWLAYNDVQCIEITNVAPHNSLPITVTSQTVTLTVERLPDLLDGEDYTCRFGDKFSIMADVTAEDTLRCTTPPASKIPAITNGDHVMVVLNVMSSETGVDFVDKEFSFYECSTHTTCVSCVGSRWSCDWCVFENRCTHDSSTCTVQNEIIVTGENNRGSSMQGADGCPQIEQQIGEILIPNNASRKITFSTANLPPVTLISNYQCSLQVDGSPQAVPAERNGSAITCDMRKYTYTATEQEFNVTLLMTWTDKQSMAHVLDDRYGFTVTLYKCEVLRPDCSRCVSIEATRAQLGCVWCGDTCGVIDSEVCSKSRDVVTPTDTLNCPDPVILTVYPKFGPLEGNTILTLMGTDIGLRYEDIKNITIGGQTCVIIGTDYMTGSSVNCRTLQSDGILSRSLQVEVIGRDGTVQRSNVDKQFGYKDPKVTDFNPKEGPQSGGTRLLITGEQLDAGRNIDVYVGDMQCSTDREEVEDDSLSCITPSADELNGWNVTVRFDGAVRSSAKKYTYKADPTVVNINPTSSVLAGGRELTVNGTGFLLIQQPQILITIGNIDSEEDFVANCSVKNDTNMVCISPEIDDTSVILSNDISVNVSTGFIMDGVTALRNWCMSDDDSCTSLQYYQNPVYNPFSGGILVKDAINLAIDGERLNLAITNAEVTVFIGMENCTGVTVGSTSLLCTLPETVPSPGDYLGKNTSKQLPVVWVFHGTTLAFNIGYIRYPGISPSIWVVCFVSGAVVLIVFVVTCYLFFMRKRAQKEVDMYLDDFDKAQTDFAGDMRTAFAELQTDVTDLTRDLEGIGMPFVSHRDYATNMLFLALDTKPRTSDPEYPEEHVELAMKKFSDALNNKAFLLTFLQTLDEQSKVKLPIRDKCAIASLLTVIMVSEDRLGYFTDVLFSLMTNLVQDELDAGRPKQLFRRTETILEKLLSNWIALCLYDSLKDHTGYPLFILYRAIKCHCEHGPIDVITGKAKFTLSNDKLLTEDIEYREMTLTVIVNDADGETKEIKVLDIDTISQVKEKILDAIHRNQKYSQRPNAHGVDLEWRNGTAGRIVLRDLDNSNATLDGWKRTNTLRSYHVPNKSTMALILLPPEKESFSPTNMTHDGEPLPAAEADNTYVNLGFTGKKSAGNTRAKQSSNRYTIVEVDENDSASVWHLVKVEDGDVDDTTVRRKKKGHHHRMSVMPSRPKKRFREIYIPRLISTKGTIQEYINSMFDAILDASTAPKTVKYLFDFFDSQATRHNLEDSDAVKIWKGNSLSLRFWSNVIRHADFIFDIRPSRAVEASLGVIAQAFYDAHNASDQKLGKDSDLSKLLFNKDLPRIEGLVHSYYQGITDKPRVTMQELNIELSTICQNFTGLFSKLSTLLQLWSYVKVFNPKIVEALGENEEDSNDHLSYKLVEIETILSNKDCDAVDSV